MAPKKPPATRIELDGLARERLSRATEAYFAENWDEPISDLRRRIFLSWVEDEVGYLFYNRGIQDAMLSTQQSQIRLHEDLDLLQRITP